jgi:hypothetical protein
MARGASGVWLRAVSRLGLVCRGMVYVLVGFLALRLALAAHRGTAAPASAAGAVQEAVGPGWGRVTLVLLVAGLGAYALTQLIEAVFRPSRATGAMGAWRQRAVSSWGCLLYLAFCLSTALHGLEYSIVTLACLFSWRRAACHAAIWYSARLISGGRQCACAGASWSSAR